MNNYSTFIKINLQKVKETKSILNEISKKFPISTNILSLKKKTPIHYLITNTTVCFSKKSLRSVQQMKKYTGFSDFVFTYKGWF